MVFHEVTAQEEVELTKEKYDGVSVEASAEEEDELTKKTAGDGVFDKASEK